LTTSNGFIGEFFYIFGFRYGFIGEIDFLLWQMEEDGEFSYIYDDMDFEFFDNHTNINETIHNVDTDEDWFSDDDDLAQDEEELEDDLGGHFINGTYYLVDTLNDSPFNSYDSEHLSLYAYFEFFNIHQLLSERKISLIEGNFILSFPSMEEKIVWERYTQKVDIMLEDMPKDSEYKRIRFGHKPSSKFVEYNIFRQSVVSRLMSSITNKRLIFIKHLEVLISGSKKELVELSEYDTNRLLADSLFNSYIGEFSSLISDTSSESRIRLEMGRVQSSSLDAGHLMQFI